MAVDLAGIQEAWEKRPAAGQRSSANAKGLPNESEGKKAAGEDDKVRKLADEYVKAHKDEFAGFEHLSLDVLVRMVEDHREKGETEKQWRIETWLLHNFEPQNIGGPAEVKVRFPNG